MPAVASFEPDFIIISAGFDAHKKDELNYRFIGVTERDYYWLTQQLVSLANAVCNGRIVSALEGGYRVQGGIVSAFSRSVAAHVRALNEVNDQVSSTPGFTIGCVPMFCTFEHCTLSSMAYSLSWMPVSFMTASEEADFLSTLSMRHK